MTEPPDPVDPSPWRPPPPGPPGPTGPAGPSGPPSWQQRPVQPPRRFSGAGVVVGLLAYIPWIFVTLLLAGLATGLISDSTNLGLGGAAVSAILLVAGLLPVAVGIVLAARDGTPWRRGFGLGLAIGWAVWGIVGAGVCVAVLALVPSFS